MRNENNHQNKTKQNKKQEKKQKNTILICDFVGGGEASTDACGPQCRVRGVIRPGRRGG